MNFEENIVKLESIIKELENGDIPLEKAIEHYKEGIETLELSKKQLMDAKQVISEYSMGEKND